MEDKALILERARGWFRESFVKPHIKNAKKLTNPKEFNINNFTAIYLAHFLGGEASAENIAKALIYPRILGTSAATSFGSAIQKFTNDVLGKAYGSTTAGIDIEFIDQLDGAKKYCQLKSGPNTINKDDITTIAGHFDKVIRLARTNNLRIPRADMIVGVVYGEPQDLSTFYKKITEEHDFPVSIGKEFWHRLTGDEHFYDDLIAVIKDESKATNFKEELDQIVSTLAATDQIQALSQHND